MASPSSAAMMRGSPRRTLSSLSTTSTSLSHAISNIDSSKPAVVIEIGSKMTKCGFAGEFVPRAILRTEFIDENLKLQKGFLENIGNDDNADLRVLAKFLKHIYFNHLLATPRERRVLIVESPLCPSHIRRAICRCLLEHLDVPSVCFAPSSLLASFPFNTQNAYVIDVGHKETVAMPVWEGVTMVNNWEASQKAGSAIQSRVRELLREHGEVEADGQRRKLTEEEWKNIEEQDLCEKIAVQYCFCTTRERAAKLREGGKEVQLVPPSSGVELPLGTNKLIVSGFIRETACEVLFEDTSDDEVPLQKIIVQTIMRCPIDMRRQLFQSLLVCGGVSLTKGFVARLKEEVVALALSHNLKCAEEVKFFFFKGQHTEFYMNWLGGALFAALQDVLSVRSVSRDEWMEKKVLPDWTDFVANPNARTGAKAA